MTTAAPRAPEPGAGPPRGLAGPGDGPAATPGGAPPPGTGPRASARLRAWQWPAAVILVILFGATVIALLRPPPGPGLPLDPRSPQPGGSEALADLLAQRGVRVTRTATAGATAAAAKSPGATVVVTTPGALTGGQLAALARVRANLVLVAPGRRALAALAPPVTLAGLVPPAVASPGCGLAAARLAGPAGLGGTALRTRLRVAQRCYPAAGLPGGWGLVRYQAGGRTVTVLATGAPLTNQELARQGNAALGLNLLGGGRRVVWLVPPPAPAAAAPAPPPGQRSLFSLLPAGAYLVTGELAVAAALAALWRMRRFGPLVAEPVPVVIRASETTEGHARLYQSRRSRDRAAAILRTASAARLLPRLGLPGDAAPAAVAAELARRTGRTATQIEALLYGPAPRDDGALVRLAADLDTLEGEVITP